MQPYIVLHDEPSSRHICGGTLDYGSRDDRGVKQKTPCYKGDYVKLSQ